MNIKPGKKSHILTVLLLLIIILAVIGNILSEPFFNDPTSTVLYDRNGELLGARISKDGQWRFPRSDSIPDKFKACIINFEDRHFYKHPGFNPFSLARALIQNLKAGEIVSGGSTITMQVIRLSRKNKARTIREKLIEILMALNLELRYSKKEILNLYASYAPFGGNVVGLETAAWRYFSTNPFNLSWSETSFLAVLPNAPSLMHPGKNRELLLAKRNRLLQKLRERNIITDIDYELAVSESLPEAPRDLPSAAYHLTERFNRNHEGKRIFSTVDKEFQEKVNEIIHRSKTRLYAMGIHNAACLVTKVDGGEVIAYVGNIRNRHHPEYGGDVDIIPSSRSSGSILKPLLYSMMQYRGEILPHTIVGDIPTRYGNYSPKNYKKEYDGIVKASEALARSLNVPAVRMLHQYGNERFLNDLRNMGISTLDKPGDYYGLSLILGGAECSLEDLTSVYSSMARVLNHFNNSEGRYFRSDWKEVHAIREEVDNPGPDYSSGEEQGKMGAGSIWLTLEALREVERPASQDGWKIFSSTRKVAWKTGTSFGFRDGWAIGTTPEYVVSIWTGNADGEGRPGLTGLNAASPILFDVFNVLPQTSWFEIPYDDLSWVQTCKNSGHIAGRFCPDKDSILVSPAGFQTPVCNYHKLIHLNKEKKFRVNSSCYPVNSLVHKTWFILPPLQEWYYKQRDPSYLNLPPMAEGCKNADEISQIQIIYPDPGSVIYIPYELDGKKGRVIFEAAHRDPETRIFWSIDEEYFTSTTLFHQISLLPEEGKHVLNLIDENGNHTDVNFEVIER